MKYLQYHHTRHYVVPSTPPESLHPLELRNITRESLNLANKLIARQSQRRHPRATDADAGALGVIEVVDAVEVVVDIEEALVARPLEPADGHAVATAVDKVDTLVVARVRPREARGAAAAGGVSKPRFELAAWDALGSD